MRNRIKWAVLALIASTGCFKDPYPRDAAFLQGFENIPWGGSSVLADSLVRRDSAWTKVSSIVRSQTRGPMVVVSRSSRDYYLEFDERDRFFRFSYIAPKDDLDSVEQLIARYYRAPASWDKSNPNFENKIWIAETDSVALEIQFLITKDQYALKIANRWYER